MMRRYAVPKIGKVPVSEIEPDDVLKVLRPIWLEKQETARRMVQRMRAVFDWAIVGGHRTTANPVAHVRAALLPQKAHTKHFAALPYADLSEVMDRLAGVEGLGALALRFTILTAVRSGETRGALWSEVDLETKTWTIPAERMKASREHRAPLSDAALEILRSVEDLPGELVFPSRKRHRPLSDMKLSAALRRLDLPVTVHGFRSTFRDWCEEQTDYRHEVKEAALAHSISSAVERAYRRTDLFEKRRALMDDWARFCVRNS